MRTLADRRHEQAKADADDRDLTSRTDLRRKQNTRETELKRLARRIVLLKPQQLAALALEEELLEAVQLARALTNAGARNRQIGVVRQHLRDMGAAAAAIETRLDRGPGGVAAVTPASSPAAPSAARRDASRALAWMERLTSEGDAALGELCAECPATPRQQLRQQVRAVVKARGGSDFAAAARAERRLQQALEGLLDSSSVPS
jgi:ribosome-associated protein